MLLRRATHDDANVQEGQQQKKHGITSATVGISQDTKSLSTNHVEGRSMCMLNASSEERRILRFARSFNLKSEHNHSDGKWTAANAAKVQAAPMNREAAGSQLLLSEYDLQGA